MRSALSEHVERNSSRNTPRRSRSSRRGTGHAPHHPYLQHHFDNMEQQAEASTLGMWVFLVTEIMFFGGLFMAYLVYRTSRRRGSRKPATT
jgi:heme/copper-type cytochrome/quinol oxidase subunit 3